MDGFSTGLFAGIMILQSVNYAWIEHYMATASIGNRDTTLRVDKKPSFLLAEAGCRMLP